MGKRWVDHDRELGKIHSIRYEIEREERSKRNEPVHEEKNCYNCKKKIHCKIFKSKTANKGSYSVTADTHKELICDKWEESNRFNSHNPKKVKSLLKQAKKGKL